MLLLSDRNNELTARVVAAEEDDWDAAARALGEERAEGLARLPNVAKGAKGAGINIKDAEERRGKEREEVARWLAEAKELLEDAAWRRSEEDLGKLAMANELAKMERRLAQRVEEQVTTREVATASDLAARDARSAEQLPEMGRCLAEREDEYAAALFTREAAAADERTVV